MNLHHRAITQTTAALIGVLALAGPVAFSTRGSSASAQEPADTVCEEIPGVANQVEQAGDDLNTGELDFIADFLRDDVSPAACDGSPELPGPACEALPSLANQVEQAGDDLNTGELDFIADFLRQAHGDFCQAGPTTTSSSTSTSTTTTVPEEEKDDTPLAVSGDARVREVRRLPFEPREAKTAHVILDSAPGARRGYRIYGGSPPRVHAFDLDALRDTADHEYPDISLSYNEPPTHHAGVIAAVGGNLLFFVDSNERVNVIDGETLRRLDSFAPPLLGGGDLVVGAAYAGDQVDAILAGRRWTGMKAVINGLAYLPAHGDLSEDKLLVLLETPLSADNPGSVPNVLTLEQWNLTSGRTEWSQRLRGCTSRVKTHPLKYGLGIDVGRAPDGTLEAIIGCSGSNKRGEVWRVPLLSSGTGIGEETHVANVPNVTAFFPDPAGRRMVVLTTDTKGQFFIGVDLDREGVYGSAVGSFFQNLRNDSTLSGGLDPATGRAYGFAKAFSNTDADPGGLLLTDARRRPMPQGLLFTELNPTPANGGKHRIQVDPATSEHPRRVFVPVQGDGVIRVYEDTIPVEGEVPVADVDRFTKDVPEEKGKTRAAFNGSSSAYGVRVLLTGGLYSLASDHDAVRNTLQNESGVGGVFPGCEPPDRELVLAQVSPKGTNLSNTGANASAVAAEVDERTRQDLDRPVASCWPTQGLFSTLNANVDRINEALAGSPAHPLLGEVQDEVMGTPIQVPSSDPDAGEATVGDLAGDGEPHRDPVPRYPERPDPLADQLIDQSIDDPFPFFPAICSLAGESARRPLPSDHPDHGEDDLVLRALGIERSLGPVEGFTARVSCAADGQSITASATAADTLGRDGALTFDGTAVDTTISRRDDGGLVAVTESRVKGVNILGLLRIGEVRSRTTVEAGGRPGTATTSHTRQWCAVSGAGIEIDACQDVNDPAFQENVRSFSTNVLAQANYELRIPKRDPELAAGTPGGALAGVQKDRFLTVGERLLNNDPRTELAALELIEVRDSGKGRARHIYQLAGIQASTAYNISEILNFEFDFDLPAFDGPPTFTPPTPSAVLAASTDDSRAVAANPAASTSAAGPAAPSPGGVLQALGNGLTWLLRNPWEAIKLMMVLFTAWALPLHLHEKRRVLDLTMTREN